MTSSGGNDDFTRQRNETTPLFGSGSWVDRWQRSRRVSAYLASVLQDYRNGELPRSADGKRALASATSSQMEADIEAVAECIKPKLLTALLTSAAAGTGIWYAVKRRAVAASTMHKYKGALATSITLGALSLQWPFIQTQCLRNLVETRADSPLVKEVRAVMTDDGDGN